MLRRTWSWWWQLSWPALQLQWGRQLAALLTIALGLALAGAVHWINASALARFEAAARLSSAQADLELRPAPGSSALPESLYAEIAAREDVAELAPQLESSVRVRAAGETTRLRLLGLDLLQLHAFHPQWLPRQADASGLMDALRRPALLASPAALRRLGLPEATDGKRPLELVVESPSGPVTLPVVGLIGGVAGPSSAPEPALLLMDIAWAQQLLQRQGQLDAIQLRMANGQTPPREWPAGVLAQAPEAQARQQAGEARRLTHAYRLNLGVLSLMALFVGAFMVFAVHSLSVAQRLPQLALLGVLGMSARQRLGLLALESLLLGLAGAVLGLLLALGLARLGLQQLGGDLGSGLMGGLGGAGASGAPALQATPASIIGLLLLGPVVSLGAAALPLARLRRLPAAQVLKGLGSEAPASGWQALMGPALLLLALPLAALPALPAFSAEQGGWPLGPYAAMLALLLGALASVPLLLRLITRALSGWARRRALPLLAVERARDQSGEAGRLIAGVLVALALAVAMLVMVASFRLSLDQWLTQMLPADLYLRSQQRDSTQQVRPLPAALPVQVAALAGVERVSVQRTRQVGVQRGGAEDSATLMARDLDHRLPLQGRTAEVPAGRLPVYVNEAMRAKLRLRAGDTLMVRVEGRLLPAGVRGVWRDYSRQSPALLVERKDWEHASGDTVFTELALWLSPGADENQVQQALRRLEGHEPAGGTTGTAPGPGSSAPPTAWEPWEMASAGELRRFSMMLFDRSFAITYWLQAVGLGLGLFGVAASLSAQLLARRREFGLLLHLGLTRAMLRRLVLGESLLQAAAGTLLGVAVGLAISAVLVFRLNPQSFHWSMDWQIPWGSVLALMAASLLASALTAAWAGARALRAGQGEALRAVREDW